MLCCTEGKGPLLGIFGTPPIVSSLCFRVNLTANQRGDYERMRCRYNMIIEVSAAVSKIVAVTVSSKGRFAARFTGNFAYVLSILDCSCVCVPPRFHDRSFWKLGTEVNVKWQPRSQGVLTSYANHEAE